MARWADMDGERGQNHFELVSRAYFDRYKYLRHATYVVFALSCGGFFGDYFRDVKRTLLKYIMVLCVYHNN